MDALNSPDNTLAPEFSDEEDEEQEMEEFRLPELSLPPSLPPANLLIAADVAPVKRGLSRLPLNNAPPAGYVVGQAIPALKKPVEVLKPLAKVAPIQAAAVTKKAPMKSLGSGRGGKAMKKAAMGLGGAKRHRKILRDTIQGITKPAIRRLARRGGVKRISGEVYDDVRGALKDFLKKVINDATIYCEHARRKTVSVGDVVNSLRKNGRTLYGC